MNYVLKRMGVMNVTPNSFSDGGELNTLADFRARLQAFGPVDAVDLGAESTAPKNSSVSWEEEWERIERVLPWLHEVGVLSLDTYHPETIFKFASKWRGHLIWNDVSGKFDEHVEKFLRDFLGHEYVFCHNRAPSRELSGRHMDYVGGELDLVGYFAPFKRERVIFDPCLGFSKSYEENWWILENFGEIQQKVGHSRWLVGFSRKSFLRKKFGTDERGELDRLHGEVLRGVLKGASGEVWVRTHRPELC